jgi:hypothetical protein
MYYTSVEGTGSIKHMVLVELLDGEGSWDSKTLVYYSVGLCLKKIYITDPEAKK